MLLLTPSFTDSEGTVLIFHRQELAFKNLGGLRYSLRLSLSLNSLLNGISDMGQRKLHPILDQDFLFNCY